MSETTQPVGGDPRRQRGRNRKLVLDALRAADKPLGAYELLRQLRGEGLRSPLQVYRALNTLITEGSVHKIESVSAYTLCKEEQHAPGGLVVRFRHLHPFAAHSQANVGIKGTTSNYLILVEL